MDNTVSPVLFMTELEKNLKLCYLQRPDLHDRILTTQELADYTVWMAKEYGSSLAHEKRKSMISGIYADRDNPMMDAGRRILSNPNDPGAMAQLSSYWGKQQENGYFHPEQDISAWQMLRYMPAHWHQNEYFEMYYSFSGECPVHFANEIVTVRPGTILIVAPHVTHANPCYRDDQVLVYYNIRSSTFDQVFWNHIPAGNLLSNFFRRALSGQQPNSYLHFETDGDKDIRHILGSIYREYLKSEAYHGELLNSLMSIFFILLLRRYESSARLPRSEGFYWTHRYTEILSYIQSHYDTVNLYDLSNRFHYSDKQLRRIIQVSTSLSFQQLIIKLRMENAAELLRRPDMTIAAVSATVGYSTVSSFYRRFIEYYGCTPGEYWGKNTNKVPLSVEKEEDFC